MAVIAVFNQKSGDDKTTPALSVSAGFAILKRDRIAIDPDAQQGHLRMCAGQPGRARLRGASAQTRQWRIFQFVRERMRTITSTPSATAPCGSGGKPVTAMARASISVSSPVSTS